MAEETAGVSNMHLINITEQTLTSSLLLRGGHLHTTDKGTKPSFDINPADFCSVTSEINLAQAGHLELVCWKRSKHGEEILMEI